ncbi:MAG TPA: 7TM domain-containing protein [Thermodesulfobacteriota bacterium]|nr:7TM domain-containing protein [Thermodesulfobacteriota bacterium]
MKRPALLLAVALLILSFGLISYRILWLKYPVLPAAPAKVWQFSMNAFVKGGEKVTTVMIGLPSTQKGQLVVEERIHPGTLSFNLLREGPNQIGVWSGVVTQKGDVIGYSSTIQVQPQRPLKAQQPPRLGPYPKNVGESEWQLAARLVENWNPLPPAERLRRIAAALNGSWGASLPNAQDFGAWSALQNTHGRMATALVLLRAAGLPAKAVEGLLLAESVTSSTVTWIEVWTGQEWENLQPEKGEIYQKPLLLLPLTTGGLPVLRTLHGELSEVRWTLNRQIINQWRMKFEIIMRSNRWLDRWSLFRLPEEFQKTFRILMLVPIGALMICVLRNIVGFPTFGIFLPVLMALAFRNTGLAYGLGVFWGVVLIGYVVRRWIDKLRLLLVPRLSVILTLVIICITIFALLGNKFGLRQFMAVGLLPFVILTMTIERFFVIIEEAGPREGLWTAAGSAGVAVVTYGILEIEPLQLTFFVYPELLFAVAALQVLLGRYTGYRLLEIFRFRGFWRS